MRHEVKYEDLQEWIDDSQLLMFASSSASGGKKLYATLRGSFEVHSKGVMVWQGMQPFRAVQEYNKI